MHSLVRYEPSEVHVLIEVWYMYALLLRPFCYMPHNVNLCCGRDTRMHMLPFRACAGMIPTPPHKLAFWKPSLCGVMILCRTSLRSDQDTCTRGLPRWRLSFLTSAGLFVGVFVDVTSITSLRSVMALYLQELAAVWGPSNGVTALATFCLITYIPQFNYHSFLPGSVVMKCPAHACPRIRRRVLESLLRWYYMVVWCIICLARHRLGVIWGRRWRKC